MEIYTRNVMDCAWINLSLDGNACSKMRNEPSNFYHSFAFFKIIKFRLEIFFYNRALKLNILHFKKFLFTSTITKLY